MSEQNKALVRRTFEEIWNQKNLANIEEQFSADYVGHSVSPIQGPEGAKRFAAGMLNAFPDYHYTVDAEIAEADQVVHRWTVHGTHQGELMGIAPTSKRVTITGISIYRVANGKIVEGWTNADMLGLMQQLGAIPAPGHS